MNEDVSPLPAAVGLDELDGDVSDFHGIEGSRFRCQDFKFQAPDTRHLKPEPEP